jgi:hypothetical protein
MTVRLSMKRFVAGQDRRQGVLLPEFLDDWVSEENPVRAIDAFVDELDLARLGFEGVTPAATGGPGYHPGLLLKLYVCGYLDQVAPSRRLEREAGRNVELMWLTMAAAAAQHRNNPSGIFNRPASARRRHRRHPNRRDMPQMQVRRVKADVIYIRLPDGKSLADDLDIAISAREVVGRETVEVGQDSEVVQSLLLRETSRLKAHEVCIDGGVGLKLVAREMGGLA